MALDAFVYCDCFERGRLRSPPPPGCVLSETEDGALSCGSNDPEVYMAFDRWCDSEACEHERGQLANHHIGNVALVADLRDELSRSPERFPMIMSRVIYNGIHCGDFIPADEVPRLIPEIEALAAVECQDPETEPYLREFASQMRELVAAALRVNKPLVF